MTQSKMLRADLTPSEYRWLRDRAGLLGLPKSRWVSLAIATIQNAGGVTRAEMAAFASARSERSVVFRMRVPLEDVARLQENRAALNAGSNAWSLSAVFSTLIARAIRERSDGVSADDVIAAGGHVVEPAA